MPYDQAAKALLQTALTTLGRAEVQHEVPPGEPAWVDVLFEPGPQAPSSAQHGLLGAMASSAALFEPFSVAPTTSDVWACLRKQLALGRGRATLPTLWILAAARPSAVIGAFAMRARRGWPRGVYAGASHRALPVYVVVASELPIARDTLLLRLMGTGRTLLAAVREARSLELDAWEHRPAVAALSVLRFRLDSIEPVDEELAMEITETYEQWEERVTRLARERAIEEGKAEGKAEVALRLLARRFGAIEEDAVRRVRTAPEAELDAILDRVLTASSLAEALG